MAFALNQDKPYIRPLLQRNDLPAQFLAFQPVQVVDHHYPALLSARFQPGQRPILPGQFLTGEVSLKSEELRREIIALEERADIWLILISRSPVPTWLMPQHIKSVFVVISEKDLRMGRSEIAAYLESRGIAYTEEDMRLLEVTAEGNAYILHHVALRMKEGLSPGSELHAEIWDAFAAYLENVVLVRWDSDLLEFLMQVSVVDEFTAGGGDTHIHPGVADEQVFDSLGLAALLEQP